MLNTFKLYVETDDIAPLQWEFNNKYPTLCKSLTFQVQGELIDIINKKVRLIIGDDVVFTGFVDKIDIKYNDRIITNVTCYESTYDFINSTIPKQFTLNNKSVIASSVIRQLIKQAKADILLKSSKEYNFSINNYQIDRKKKTADFLNEIASLCGCYINSSGYGELELTDRDSIATRNYNADVLSGDISAKIDTTKLFNEYTLLSPKKNDITNKNDWQTKYIKPPRGSKKNYIENTANNTQFNRARNIVLLKNEPLTSSSNKKALDWIIKDALETHQEFKFKVTISDLIINAGEFLFMASNKRRFFNGKFFINDVRYTFNQEGFTMEVKGVKL